MAGEEPARLGDADLKLSRGWMVFDLQELLIWMFVSRNL